MKHLLIAMLSTFTFAACVEAPETPAPTELVAPEVSLADQSAITATTPPSDDPAALAPQCGDGPITYFDWVCLNDGRGWQFMAVGYRDYHCNAAPGTPYYEALVGRATNCSSSDRIECSSGLPSASCTWQPVGSRCRITRPTTYCWVRPPLPLPLPLPPIESTPF